MDKYRVLFDLNNRIIDFFGLLLMIKRIPLLLRDREYRKRNQLLINEKKHNSCYVLGTGPSLKTIDLSKIDGDTIATNMFYQYDDSSKLNPDFYILVDEDYYIGDAKKYVPEIFQKYPNSTFLLNGLYRKEIESIVPNNLKVNYVYLWNGAMNSRKRIDCTKILPAMNNVVNIAISVGIFMKYDRIILLGCDFSSFAATKKVHCYNDEEAHRNMTLAYELYNYSLVAEAHLQLDKYAKMNGIKILNATKGSLIDAYERIPSEYLEK